ncbi:DUF4180 domain-containing protein [Actinomadura chokoriensis]|uniref:DUF4180 domain-containing protein n=1 Tax=Actinomadura chokoriensis TaxID=454156 RepID=A0ABV4QXI7_9ACTN
MADAIQERAGTSVLVCDPDGPLITTEQDALDLIGATYLGADVVAVPVSRLDERFFTLGTRFAGEIMQKFVNYRVRLAVVGDIAPLTAASPALAALVRESNAAGHVWFVPDLQALDDRLRRAA